MSRAPIEEQFKFLISCVRWSNNGRVDFGEVAKECSIVSKGAAAKRYERMMKTHGIASGPPIDQVLFPVSKNTTVAETSPKKKTSKSSTSTCPPSPCSASKLSSSNCQTSQKRKRTQYCYEPCYEDDEKEEERYRQQVQQKRALDKQQQDLQKVQAEFSTMENTHDQTMPFDLECFPTYPSTSMHAPPSSAMPSTVPMQPLPTTTMTTNALQAMNLAQSPPILASQTPSYHFSADLFMGPLHNGTPTSAFWTPDTTYFKTNPMDFHQAGIAHGTIEPRLLYKDNTMPNVVRETTSTSMQGSSIQQGQRRQPSQNIIAFPSDKVISLD